MKWVLFSRFICKNTRKYTQYLINGTFASILNILTSISLNKISLKKNIFRERWIHERTSLYGYYSELRTLILSECTGYLIWLEVILISRRQKKKKKRKRIIHLPDINIQVIVNSSQDCQEKRITTFNIEDLLQVFWIFYRGCRKRKMERFQSGINNKSSMYLSGGCWRGPI